jgi:tRNA pseudouridine32 synthase / 23S rRNA pseudouridine746 synthase
VAVVDGRVAAPQGEIDLPLIADWPNRPCQKVGLVAGKPSRTLYQVMAHDPVRDCTRVLLQPLTGRSHQLRVHLLALGHPILGDALYAQPRVHEAAPRLLLHASELAFDHPLNGRALAFRSTPPF